MVQGEGPVSIQFIVVLVVCAVCAFCYILRKIRKSEITIGDSTFWFLFAASLVLLAVFPQIAFFFAGLLDIQSPSNFVFLYVIAVMVIHEFFSTAEIAKLRARVAALAQDRALDDLARREAAQRGDASVTSGDADASK